MAREEKAFNEKFGTHDVKYQNLLKKIKYTKSGKLRQSYMKYEVEHPKY